MQIFGLFAHGLVAGSLAHFKVAKVVNEALGNKDAYNHGVEWRISSSKGRWHCC